MGPKLNTPSGYFDELCEISSVLCSGLEQEWIEFISSQADLQQRVFIAEGEVSRMRLQLNTLKSDKEAADLRLKHVRKQLSEEQVAKKALEKQNEKLVQQVSVIKEILEDKDRMSMMTEEERQDIFNKSVLRRQFEKVFDENSMELDSDESLEPSFDNLEDSRKWRRKSRGAERQRKSQLREGPNAKKKRLTKAPDSDDETADEVYMNMEQASTESSEPPVLYPNLKKFDRAPPPLRHPPTKARLQQLPESTDDATSIQTTDTESDIDYVPPTDTQSDTESVTSTTSESSVPHRTHHFILRNQIKPETCKACRRKIGFSHSLRCKFCRIVVHQDCKTCAPLPCVPILSTPSHKQDGTLASYVPKHPPHVPSILVKCIQEIEGRGLVETGLWRTSGSEKVVKDLIDKMLRPKCHTNLRKIDDTSVLTGVVKSFLMKLKQPLLTESLNEEFKLAAEKNSLNYLYDVIGKLPHENRDTLAFLIVHLQKVADSEQCKMPRNNLSRVLSPTLMGNFTTTSIDAAMKENKRNGKVIDALLSMPPSYWEGILNRNDQREDAMSPGQAPDTPGTPEMLKVQPGMYNAPSSTGPCSTPTGKDRGTFTQRMFSSKKRGNFFSDPHITP